jgi:hypothetical protein
LATFGASVSPSGLLSMISTSSAMRMTFKMICPYCRRVPSVLHHAGKLLMACRYSFANAESGTSPMKVSSHAMRCASRSALFFVNQLDIGIEPAYLAARPCVRQLAPRAVAVVRAGWISHTSPAVVIATLNNSSSPAAAPARVIRYRASGPRPAATSESRILRMAVSRLRASALSVPAMLRK